MDPDFIPPMIGPDIEDIQTVDGTHYQRITYPDGRIGTRIIPTSYDPTWLTGGHTWIPDPSASSVSWTASDYGEFRKHFESEEYKDVDVYRRQSYNSGEHIVACSNEKDLAPENILKTLSAIKGKLMVDIAPIHIQKFECSMTPLVRKTIVEASKKLKMYGKKRPIVARFDEFGNRLPDEIDLGTTQGITLKIIDPDEYGKYYMELKGVEFPKIDNFIEPEDLPF